MTADPREALAPRTEAGKRLAAWLEWGRSRLAGVSDPHLICVIEDEAAALAARQDEPSPALRDALDQVESIAEFVEDHLDGFHTEPGEDDCRERLHVAVATLTVMVRALAANPPQTREAEGA